jgi:hypothetical protein
MGKKLALYCGRAMVEKRRQISQIHLPEDPVFGTRYFTTCVFLFFDGSPWYQMQPKKIWKIFWPQKRGFSTGLNTQKKIFLNFFLEFLGDFVPWY